MRTATTADLDQVEAIVAAAYGPWIPVIGRRPAPMDADYNALIAAGHVRVVDGPTGVEAVLVLIPEADCLLLDNVAVRPDLHGRGIGSGLLAYAETEARRLGLPEVRLYTHERMESNLERYKAIGYVETGRERIADGPDSRVFLRKPLG